MKNNRWSNLLFGILIILIILLTLFTSYHLFLKTPTREAARLLINILKPLSQLLVTIVLFVILRSLVKLYFTRRDRVIGYRLRTKLILSLLPLTVLPSVALLFLATRSVDDFLLTVASDTGEANIIQYADAFVRDHFDKLNGLHQKHGEPLLARYLEGDVGRIKDYLQTFGIAGVEIFDNGAMRYRILSPDFPGERIDRVEETSQMLQEGLAQAGEPVAFSDGFLIARYRFAKGAIQLYFIDTLENGYSERYLYIRDSASFLEYSKRKTNQLRDLDQGVLLVITLTLLFAGIWTALTFSKRFIDAFSVVITGAKQVSEGNLETRLQLKTGDEMEDVMVAFNMMTSKLQDNQEELEQKARDLSQLNAELSGQIQYNQTILQQTNAGILSTDTDNCLKTSNPAARKILHLDQIEVGVAFAEVLHAEHHKALLRHWQEFKRDQHGTHYRQLEIFSETGQPQNVASSIVPLVQAGQHYGSLIVLEDLTQLFNAQKLAAWREVAKRVAHEIKNPLTPIQLSIQRIQRKASKNAPDLIEAVGSAYETIMSETDLLKNLVNEFSTFAKLPDPTRTKTDLGELVAGVRTSYEPVYPNIDMILQVPEEDVSFHCDAGQVRQVLSNLINNAATACDGKGKIWVALKDNGDDVEICVCDEGRGIPASERDKVFLPYYSKSPKGTGLGLAIVKRIVVDHGGEICVRANQPKGTLFQITLPRP